MEIEKPVTEKLFQVVGVFGADNEASQRWVAVGNASYDRTKVEKEIDYWRNTFPHRRWAIMEGTTTWEVNENV